jgi:hypothetical protein
MTATPNIVLCDSQTAIATIISQKILPKTKHIMLKEHFLREYVNNNTIKIEHVKSELNLADLFTKPLPTPRFTALVQHILH